MRHRKGDDLHAANHTGNWSWPLKVADAEVAERHAAVVLEPHDFADLVFN